MGGGEGRLTLGKTGFRELLPGFVVQSAAWFLERVIE